MNAINLLCLVVLIGSINVGVNALKCYSCDDCKDPFAKDLNADKLATCAADAKFCEKTTDNLLVYKTTTRKCVATCTQTPFSLGIGKVTNCCTTDGCNHSTSIMAFQIINLLIVPIVILLSKIIL